MMWIRDAVVLLVMLAAGCTGMNGGTGGVAITAEQLLAGAPLGVGQQPPALVDEREVLAMTPEMRAFVEDHVNPRVRNALQMHQLVRAIINSKSFGLEYDRTTRTASETFRERRGNCLSFSNLFVAMARHVGLDVQYQEVDIPPDWTATDDAYVLNRHVNVSVDLGTRKHAVDFNIDEFRTSYDRRLIPDRRAFAHYYNNKGVEHMQAGDPATAVAYFHRAIADNDRRFAPAWTNLGILYLREGFLDHAEASFHQALKANPGDYVAMSNLAGLYQRSGDHERAEIFRRRVARHRRLNPYYRYHRAREAYDAEDYEAAIGHLRFAIRKRKREDRFYFMLGLCHLKRGNQRAAWHWLGRAQEIAASNGLKDRYADQIETLLDASDER